MLNFLAAAETATEETKNFDWNNVLQTVINWLSTNGLKLLIGLIVLFVAFMIVNGIAKGIRKVMMKKGVEATVYTVTYKVIRVGLKILLFLLFLGYVGIDTAGVGTIIASFGVALGLALQGSLSNLAGGIIILLMRPFRLGDFIEAQGHSGTVEEIKVFYTYLVTPDNKVVMIPNGALSNDSIVNYSQKGLRRVDINFSISYDDDFKKAETVILDLCKQNEMILNDPAEPFVRLQKHGASSLDLVMRVWTKSENYWPVYFQMMEDVKTRFDEEGITIPYSQMDVHMQCLPAPAHSACLTVNDPSAAAEMAEKVQEEKAE